MPQIYDAFASEVRIGDKPIEGLQSIEYTHVKNRHDISAIGTDERIAVYFGMKIVTGKLRVASVSAALDDFMASNSEFKINVTLKHGSDTRNVSFDGCYMEDKTFAMSAQGHGEAVYSFTATRVREGTQ
jgi:hypothetical protein